jgi:hypothetical protein
MFKTFVVAMAFLTVSVACVSVALSPAGAHAADVVAARTVTTVVQANSSGEAVVKAQNRYPKGKVTGVRKTGGAKSKSWIVTLRLK